MIKIWVAIGLILFTINAQANNYFTTSFEFYELCELEGYFAATAQPLLKSFVELLKRHEHDRYEDATVGRSDAYKEALVYGYKVKLMKRSMEDIKLRLSKRIDANVRSLSHLVANQLFNQMAIQVDKHHVTISNTR